MREILKRLDALWYRWNPRGYWERRGEFYFLQECGLPCISTRAEFIAGEINKLGVKSVLEVGCGYGAILKPLSRIGLEELTGCDFSHSQLGMAFNYLGRRPVRLLYADVTKRLPFDDNSFDLVFTSGVLMHIPPSRIDKARDEITRVSRKYVIHNESLTKAAHMFGYDNAGYYQERGYKIAVRMNPYDADENMQFVVVRL